jgi:hypothetical protein
MDVLADNTPDDEWDTPEEDVELTTETDFDEEGFAFDEADISEESETEEQPLFEDEVIQDETEAEEDLINCKKCGRSTPASEKFCVNCGAKAQ